MAYIVYDPDASSFIEPSYLSALDRPASYFITGGDPHGGGSDGGGGIGSKRNLLDAFDESSVLAASTLLPLPSAKDTVRVFLRVKPKTLEESDLISASALSRPNDDDSLRSVDGENEMVQIESEHQIALSAPRESNTYKNCMNGAGKLVHRYSFTKIFPPLTDQKGIFHEMVLPRMQEFMEGQNQLVFTYGASSSGKTYTIQGTNDDPGILPRALDVIFNSIGDHQMLSLDLKPNCFNRVVQMKDKDIKQLEADKQEVFQLALDLQVQTKKALAGVSDSSKDSGTSQLSADSLACADVTNMTQECVTSLFPELSGRTREDSVVALKHDDINYAIWISFAEIYNESISDLLEKVPEPKRKGDKPRRNALKLAEDPNGSIYIKGLREIKVNSADEAYQVMMIGRENLHFAATRLNLHSSRSHCIFSIKIIRVAKTAKPHLARVSMLTFCDLAGSERIKKTMNVGERQKEAGNINTSLMVLGRCMKAIRQNQQIKDSKRHQMVPFRDSKLTRLFQSFLVGHGKASMIVNISQAPYLFDESMQVLKFAAIANKITIEQIVKTPETVKPMRKKTRFSMMVNASKRSQNPLMGRGSIEWEMPAIRSTLCPPTIEESFMDETSVLEETVIDQRYEKLLKLIDDLRDQLVKEKMEKKNIEKDVRSELCEEFNVMMVEVEQRWEKRLQDEKERSEELADWRIETLQTAYRNKRKQADSTSDDPNETVKFQNAELELALEESKADKKYLEEKVEAMKEAHHATEQENKKLQEDLSKVSTEVQKEKQKLVKSEQSLDEMTKQLEIANKVQQASAESQSASPIIEDMERKLREAEEKFTKLEEEKANLKALLDEAGDDFVEKDNELNRAVQSVKELEKQMMKQGFETADLKSQILESRLVLTDSNQRLEEAEKSNSELEEQLEELREQKKALDADLLEAKQQNVTFAQEKSNLLLQISDLKKEKLERLEELQNADRMKEEMKEKEEKIAELQQLLNEQLGEVRKLEQDETNHDRIARALNDEIEQMKQANKKLKQKLDEKSSTMQSTDKEISTLQSEVKSLIQAEKQQRSANEESIAEIAMLRKQLKDINAKQPTKSEVERLNKKNEEQASEIEKLSFQLNSLKKEDEAFQVLKQELEERNREKADLTAKVNFLQGEVAAKDYDVKKTRDEREQAMNHFNLQLRKRTDELAVEKRETRKMREVMSNSTPTKFHDRKMEETESEVKMLRDELMKKTEVIKQLEAMIPARKTVEDTGDDLKKQMDDMKRSYEHKLAKVVKAKDKIIQEYRETNLELQKHVGNAPAPPSSSTSMVTDASTLEADDSLIMDKTPGRSRKRRRVTASDRSKRVNRTTDSASQASFEDSNVENDNAEEGEEEEEEEEDRPRKKKSNRVTRVQPIKRTFVTRASRSTDNGGASNSILKEVNNSTSSSVLLEAITEEQPFAAAAAASAVKKRMLYKESICPEVFTPPAADLESSAATPRTVVRRQLRSRNKAKK